MNSEEKDYLLQLLKRERDMLKQIIGSKDFAVLHVDKRELLAKVNHELELVENILVEVRHFESVNQATI
jgi:hypothetical protein